MRRRGERGQALVETAIVLPMLLTLLLGLLQFGLVFHSYLSVEEAARVGVRAWAVGQAATQAEVQNVVDEAMPSLDPGDIGSVQLCVNGVCGQTCTTSSPCAEPTGSELAVSVSYTQPVVVPPFDALFGPSLPLSATVVMEAE